MEHFMRVFFLHAAKLSDFNEMVFRAYEDQGLALKQPYTSNFYIFRDRIGIQKHVDLSKKPELILESFLQIGRLKNINGFDFNSMQKLSQYPMRSHFTGLLENLEDLDSLSKNWILSQKLINLDNKIKFFKTHHVMCNFGKNSFTNYENTFGVIYIVRDPKVFS